MDAEIEARAEAFLKQLEDAKFKIPPYLVDCFWDNTDVPGFAARFTRKIFIMLMSLVATPVSTGSSQASATKELDLDFDALTLSLVYLLLGRRRSFPENSWKAIMDRVITDERLKSRTMIGAVQFLQIGNWVTKAEVSIDEWLTYVTRKYDGGWIVERAVPFISFFSLVREIITSDNTWTSVFPKFCDVFAVGAINSHRSALIFVHLINISMELCPSVVDEKSTKVTALKDVLKGLLGWADPVSTTAAVAGEAVESDVRYHGSGYFNLLKHCCAIREATDSVIILHDASCEFFPNFMYTRMPDIFGIRESMIAWSKMFTTAYFKSTKKLTDEECLSMCKNCRFNDKMLSKLGSELHITEFKGNPEVMRPSPPVPRVTFKKFLVKPIPNDWVDSPGITDAEGMQLYRTPNRTIFDVTYVAPMTKFLSERPKVDILIQPIVLVGGDAFITSVMNDIYCVKLENAVIRERSEFTNFIVPVSDCPFSNLIADYIASIDPVYDVSVRPVYETVTRIAPTFDDASEITIPMEIQSDTYDSPNMWSAKTTPNTLLQLGIQHYTMFARNILNVRIWKAVLKIGKKSCSVPFCASVIIGSLFSGVPEKSVKKLGIHISRKEVGSDTTVASGDTKIYSVALWATNAALSVKGDDPFLLDEIAISSNDNQPITAREPDKVKQTMVTRWQAKGGGLGLLKEVFTVVIDGRTHQNVREITVSPLPDPNNEGDQSVFRVATFADVACSDDFRLPA